MRGPQTPPPGVSVVIPVRDRAALLAETLRSVAAQTVAPAEVIVVDDGSRDDSAAVAERAGATVISSPGGPLGPSAARNLGLERAAAELVCPLDSDDLMLPRMIELLAGALAAAPAAPFAFGRALVAARDAAGWAPRGLIMPLAEELREPLGSLYARNYVPSCAVVARAGALRETGGWRLDPPFMEDHHLWIRVAATATPVHVPEVVSVYREHPGNRHDPVRMREPTRRITELAAAEPRLARHLPERRGVQLVDLVGAAVRSRRPRAAARSLWEHVLAHRGRIRALRAAARHWRRRRWEAREAARLWESRDELRGSLSSYR